MDLKCKRSMGEIEHQTDRVIRGRSCAYDWWAETQMPKTGPCIDHQRRRLRALGVL